MAKNFFNDLFVSEARYGHIRSDEENAWTTFSCPHCGGSQSVFIAYTSDPPTQEEHPRPPVGWLRCVNCFRGAVMNGRTVSPAALPLRDVQGLDPDTEHAWAEVRGCLSVGAHIAATHMCRKILLHLAVQKGLPAKDDKGWSPNFQKCLTHLQESGYVTPPMLPWVEQIREVGNEAAHELDGPSYEDASQISQFTLQLLLLAYEMPAAMEERA